MDAVRLRLVVTGRVQGVCFRAYTREEATRLGLVGFVRNLDDGSVEVVAEGPPAAVEALAAWCHHGPPHARVADVRLTREPPTGEHRAFHVAFDGD